MALAIAKETPSPESEIKWKAVGDRALSRWKFDLAKDCYERAGDVGALFLLEVSLGNKEGIRKLAKLAGEFIFSNIFRECSKSTHLIFQPPRGKIILHSPPSGNWVIRRRSWIC